MGVLEWRCMCGLAWGSVPLPGCGSHRAAFLDQSGQVCQRIPRLTLEQSYSIRLPRPQEGEDPHRPCHAHELLNAYGCECKCQLVSVAGGMFPFQSIPFHSHSHSIPTQFPFPFHSH